MLPFRVLDHIYDYAAGTAQLIKRQVSHWTAGVRFLAEARGFSFPYSVQTVSEDHLASYAMGGWGPIFSRVKRLKREDGHSPPSSAQVKNVQAILPIAHKALCLINWYTN
jgi:hypothetical protein